MRVNISNLEILLNKLNKLTYISESADVLTTEQGFKISYTTKLHYSKNGGSFPSVQLILNVRYKNTHVTNWGCGSIEDTKIVADWFILKELEARKFEDDVDTKTRDTGINIFNIL